MPEVKIAITPAQVNTYLDKRGFKHSHLGYNYLIRAIELCSTDCKYIERITKELYPTIAKEFDTTASRVERAMRHSIETCNKYQHGGKPTNSEFIALTVDNFKYNVQE